MAFTVKKLAYRPWPISFTLQEAGADGAVEPVHHTFVGHFTRFTEDEFEAAIAAAKEKFPDPEDPAATPPYSTLLRRNAVVFGHLLQGWGPEVMDESGQSIPFTPQALTDMVTGPDGIAISGGISQALLQIRHGLAPEKNSGTSPAPGPAPAGMTETTNSKAT